MKYFYLPGKAKYNRSEMYEVCNFLKGVGVDIKEVPWLEWNTSKFDLQKELDRITKLIANINEEYGVIAKSFGTFIAIKLIKEFPHRFSRLIFLGIPYNDLGLNDQIEYSHILKNFEGKITVIQNDRDPHGSPDSVRGLLKGVDYKEIILPANNHEYKYFQDILHEVIMR